jgi:hypothetical protein
MTCELNEPADRQLNQSRKESGLATLGGVADFFRRSWERSSTYETSCVPFFRFLTPVNPCGKVKWLKYAVKGLSAAQASGHAVAAGQAFADGDVTTGMLSLVSARMSAAKLNKACFTAGTPILTENGSKPIELLKSYEQHGDECDHVLARSERDPFGPVRPRRVLQTFIRVAPIMNLHVGGRIIGTTAEHPFYVEDFGWKHASELRIGDRVLGLCERAMPVEGVADSGRVETVYNVEVEDDHTYFVGEAVWGFAVWAHNTRVYQQLGRNGKPKYFGITNNFTRRKGEWARKCRDVEEIPGLENLTRR